MMVCCLVGWTAGALEPTYWVWHRKTALTKEETNALSAQGVKRLYWHAASVMAKGEGWVLPGAMELPVPSLIASPIELVPVVRLGLDGPQPLGENAATSLCAILADAAQRTGSAEVQIDYDCPDRRLVKYAGFLAVCRARLAPIRLSATALAGWSRSPAFEKLQASVDGLAPMFYDLLPDKPADVRAGKFQPIADATTLASQIASWKTCRVPWLAGLPNFARITVFDPEGKSRGHLRSWEWDEVCFNPALVSEQSSSPGVSVLRSRTATVVANTPLAAGEALVCRWPDLRQLPLAAAEKAGAAGICLFRLPGEGTQGGWSLSQLTTLLRDQKAGEVEFQVKRTSSGLELLNTSGSDLPPRLSGDGGPQDRGWQLEIEAPKGSAIFREASPGEFANVFGHINPEAPEPQPVRIPMAQRLTYWFAALRAGESRHSGLLQLAPDHTALRWRIPHSPKNSQWQPLP